MSVISSLLCEKIYIQDKARFFYKLINWKKDSDLGLGGEKNKIIKL